jgi:hypothetical protein
MAQVPKSKNFKEGQGIKGRNEPADVSPFLNGSRLGIDGVVGDERGICRCEGNEETCRGCGQGRVGEHGQGVFPG